MPSFLQSELHLSLPNPYTRSPNAPNNSLCFVVLAIENWQEMKWRDPMWLARCAFGVIHLFKSGERVLKWVKIYPLQTWTSASLVVLEAWMKCHCGLLRIRWALVWVEWLIMCFMPKWPRSRSWSIVPNPTVISFSPNFIGGVVFCCYKIQQYMEHFTTFAQITPYGSFPPFRDLQTPSPFPPLPPTHIYMLTASWVVPVGVISW